MKSDDADKISSATTPTLEERFAIWLTKQTELGNLQWDDRDQQGWTVKPPPVGTLNLKLFLSTRGLFWIATNRADSLHTLAASNVHVSTLLAAVDAFDRARGEAMLDNFLAMMDG